MGSDVDFDAFHEVDVCGFHSMHIDLSNPLFEHLHALFAEALQFFAKVVISLQKLCPRALGRLDQLVYLVGFLRFCLILSAHAKNYIIK